MFLLVVLTSQSAMPVQPQIQAMLFSSRYSVAAGATSRYW